MIFNFKRVKEKDEVKMRKIIGFGLINGIYGLTYENSLSYREFEELKRIESRENKTLKDLKRYVLLFNKASNEQFSDNYRNK